MQITLRCRSKKERLARVRDNLKRGYMPIKFFEYEQETSHWQDGSYRDRDGAKYRYDGCSVRRIYVVIMRKKEKPVD